MEPLFYIAVGLLLGILAAVVVSRTHRTAKRTRATLRRWCRTRLTLTQTPRKPKARKGARR